MELHLSKKLRWEKLVDDILGYQAIWIADIGLKTGLFEAIKIYGSQGVQEDSLAGQLGYDAKYVGVWCRGAFAFELLDWDEISGYSLSAHMDSILLDSSDPQFLGGRIQFNAALYQDFYAFPKFLKTGDVWPRSQHDPWILEALNNMTKPDYAVIADYVLPQSYSTYKLLKNGGKILDIGSGSGFGVSHYATRFPKSLIIAIEPDKHCVKLAKQHLCKVGLTHRVLIENIDANHMDYDSYFDLVTMNVTLHEVGGYESYRNVLSKSLKALKKNGTIIVSELPYPDSHKSYRDSPVYKMMAGVYLHEALVGCGSIKKGQLSDLLQEAGFSEVREADQPIATRFMMVAMKP